MPDLVNKETRSRIMSSIHSKDTKVEWMLRSALWKRGLRYRIHVKSLPGNPDIVFPTERITVFIDGDFWHGYNWKKLKPKLKNKFWTSKIKNNIRRDKVNTRKLMSLGWKVIRVWEHELRKNAEKVARQIEKQLRK